MLFKTAHVNRRAKQQAESTQQSVCAGEDPSAEQAEHSRSGYHEPPPPPPPKPLPPPKDVEKPPWPALS